MADARSTKFALIPVAILIASILVTLFFDFSNMFVLNLPYLLLELNLIFWTVAIAAIAFISTKSFIRDGSLTILLLSSSILIFGISVIFSGWVGTFSGDYSVAVSNPCILAASILQVLSSVLSFEKEPEIEISNRKALLVVAYLVSVVFVVANSIVVLSGRYPVFFSASGPTLLRQVVLGLAVFLFAVASIIFGIQYVKSKSPSLYWYALAIGLFSIGLFSAFEVKVLGDVPTWLGRISLYAGTAYLVAAILESRLKSSAGIDLAGSWAEAFRSDRRQISTLFSKMLDAFVYGRVVVDENGTPVDCVFLEVNDAFERITGMKRESVIGKKASEVVPGVQTDPAGWISIYGRVALTGESVQFENFLEQLKRWYHVSSYSPKKGYYVAIFEDITERKQAEEKLKNAKEQYALLFSSVSEGFANYKAVYDENGRLNDLLVLEINPAGAKYSGVKREEQIGRTWRQIWVGVEDSVFEYYRKVDQTGSSFSFDHFDNLTNRWYGVTIYRISKDQFAATFTDITERKRAEENLEEYRKNLEKLVEERTKKLELSSLYARNLIEASLDPLVTISIEGKITDVNKATEQATGRSREELIGCDFSDYFTEPERAKAGYKRVFKDGFVRDYPLAIRHKSGKVTDVLYNATVYRSEVGEIQGVFAAARDITERKKAEEQAQLVSEKLKDAERLATIGATAGMVGHDIRNPLQAITSDVYLVKSDLVSVPDGKTKDSINESLVGIEANVEYINKIVQDLQDFARPLRPIAKETNLRNLCEDVLLKSNLPKNIRGSCKVDETAKKIIADPDLIRRVLNNLVANAIQAMPQGGKLSIQGYHQKGEVVVEVHDTGVGIPESVKSKLFLPLFTTKSKGQGFGLAVVKRVVEAMNGTITFESQEGKGTTFVLHLPSKS